MKFSHLVRIDAVRAAGQPRLTREQLWQGLVLRAENPRLFVMALERCEILARDEAELTRLLHFGSVRLRDRVRFAPMQQVRYDIDASASTPAAVLVMTIVEPEPGRLALRFDYETADAGQEPDEDIASMLRQAYVQADLDTVRTVCRLAATPGGLAP